MRNLITICARGGSKGIKGKNIKEINGKPLIAYTIHSAKKFQSEFGADIALSTDSIDIKKVAEKFGVKTDYIRPDYLANDTVGKLEVIEDLVKYEENKHSSEYEFILDLDVTSPLRTNTDLTEAFKKIKMDKNMINLFSVNKAQKNPYFNMVEDIGGGKCQLVKEGTTYLTRQSAPSVYSLNASFYFYRRDFFHANDKKVINQNSGFYNMEHICFDIDEEIDFTYMQFLITNNLLGFTI